jgi:hypothetical protein
MTNQVFIDSQGRERQLPSGALTSSTSLRWKAGVLQQLCYEYPTGYWWIDVPTVADDAPDVLG